MAGGRIIAANTDVNHLYIQKADKLILLGEKICKGHGCEASRKWEHRRPVRIIKEMQAELEGANLYSWWRDLGGTGTGAMPVVARSTREMGALTGRCVTIPFTSNVKKEKAREAINLLAQSCDSVVL